MDDERREKAQALLDAAYEFWTACNEAGQRGAVQWLEGTLGELIIFTRGEYRRQILDNIYRLPDAQEIYYFGEQMPPEEDDAE